MKRGALIAIASAVVAWSVGCGEKEPEPVPAPGGGDAYTDSIFREQFVQFKAAAEKGDAEGQRELAMMYYLGKGIETDYAKAFEWFKKSADQGESVAQMTLGVMYSEGQGVPQDYVRAHMWLGLSAQQGTRQSRQRLETLAGKMTPEQISEAERLTREWRPGA